MDFDVLQKAWNQASNRPDGAATEYLLESAMAELARRRRNALLRLGLTGTLLGGWTAMVLHGVLVRGNVAPTREWAAFAMLGLAWALFAMVAVRLRRHAQAHPDPGRSLPANLRALLGENEMARQRLRLLGMVALPFIAALLLALSQLADTGKMSPRNIRDFCLLMGAGFGIAAISFGWRYWRVLRPEGRRLQQLLDGYERG